MTSSAPPRDKAEPGGPELEGADFDWLRRTAKQVAGLHLARGKATIARARLVKRLRATGCVDFSTYFQLVSADTSGVELWAMVDALTVNQTQFFREPSYLPVLQQALPGMMRRDGAVTIWSAGCSSGEEPYTLGMFVREQSLEPSARVRILGTDVCSTAIATASNALYKGARISELPPEYRHYCIPVPGPQARFQIAPEVRAMVSFARHNLIGKWPMNGPMHVILCRNVMLYFDRPTQRRLVNRFYDLLAPGGYLIIGHSEALSQQSTRFQYLQPAVYQKPEGHA